MTTFVTAGTYIQPTSFLTTYTLVSFGDSAHKTRQNDKRTAVESNMSSNPELNNNLWTQQLRNERIYFSIYPYSSVTK